MKNQTHLMVYPRTNTLKQRWTVALYSILGLAYHHTISRDVVNEMLKDLNSK